jgi:threonine aldolase
MDKIDFRSDTVTWPTPAMCEDPTVNALEAKAAAMLGKEAGVFVASGTMGNLVGILAQATRGDQVLLGADAHTFRSEAGSLSALGGLVPRPLLTDQRGMMAIDDLEAALSPDDPHYPKNRMVAVENTYSARQGYPQPLNYLARIRSFADQHGLSVHLDGARLFNAAAALGVGAAEIAQYADSVSFCLSKGLCAPIGSVVCGTSAFSHEARRIRKALGGGMRQAGIVAAAGIVALEQMVDRLVEDHRLAKYLAEKLADTPGIKLNPDEIHSNIIHFSLDAEVPWTAAEVVQRVREQGGILLGTSGQRRFRAVTHFWVGRKEADALLGALALALAK